MSRLALVSALEERIDTVSARGLAEAVSRAMYDAVLRDGDLLPPIRMVATELGLSPTTVSAAWAMLRRAGTVTTDGRRGTRVTKHTPGPSRYRAARNRSIQKAGSADGSAFTLDLSTGTPDPALLPDIGAALRAVLPPEEPESYLDDPVLPQLAALLHDSWPYRAERITVVDGAMDALQMVVATHLSFGDAVAVEQPSFPPLLDLLEASGITVIPVDLDDDGPRPTSLATAIARGVKALIFQPRGHNPSGARLTVSRRDALASALAKTSVLVIEDDSVGDISTAAPVSLGTVLPARTIHIRSFSKSHGPDLRLAAVGGPLALLDPLIDRRFLGQGWTSRLLQQVLVTLLTDPVVIADVAAARDEYSRRRNAVIDVLARRGITVGGCDGLNIWLPVADETAALLLLASHGVAALPGNAFVVGGVEQPHLRITTGRIATDLPEIADLLADAAGAGPWAAAR